jgi:hypothetical protein
VVKPTAAFGLDGIEPVAVLDQGSSYDVSNVGLIAFWFASRLAAKYGMNRVKRTVKPQQ